MHYSSLWYSLISQIKNISPGIIIFLSVTACGGNSGDVGDVEVDESAEAEAEDEEEAIPNCGNGEIDVGEECDDGNDIEGDGCDNDCMYSCHDNGECSNGNVCDGDETCNTDTHECVAGTARADGVVCLSDPRRICLASDCVDSTCGDGFVDTGAGESCEPPNEGTCGSNCRWTCNSNEDCPSDGNACNGEEYCNTGVHECASQNPLEDGTVCNDSPRMICIARTCQESMCGDTYLDEVAGEECDDGNTFQGDGCDNDCQFSCHSDQDCDDGHDCTEDICDTAVTHTCNSANSSSSTMCRTTAGECDVAELCTGSSPDCPVDTFLPATETCREAIDICDSPENCTGFSATCPADAYENTTTICRASEGPCDVAEYCSGTSVSCPLDNLAPNTTECRSSAGACDTPEFCAGTSIDCPSDDYLPNTTICRTAGGVCDVEEYCTGLSSDCPSDTFVSNTQICRPSAGNCDLAENCTGISATCPIDSFKQSTEVCRQSAGDCDLAENCTGTSAYCATDSFKSSTQVCRPAAGNCDIAENCTGTSVTCPADTIKSSSDICRSSAGPCDITEYCTGTTTACPGDTFQPNTLECRPSSGTCDVAEYCTGVSASCPGNTLLPATSECRSSAGVCDVAEFCTGSSAICPLDAFRPVTMQCRSTAGICDLAEYCTGSSALCPNDAFRSSSTQCRAAIGTCDVAEYCTGNSAPCPVDSFQPAGTPCDDSVYCTNPDECDGAGACMGIPADGLYGLITVAAGGYHTCALLSTGGVKCWGNNGWGQLGDGTTTSRTSPVDVSGLSSGISAITAGSQSSCALTNAGGVKCWGDNGWGQLGDGSTTNRWTSVDVIGLSSGVADIDAGGVRTCALMSTTGVKCWGQGDTSPVDVSGLSSGVSAISVGGMHVCVLMSTGGVKCWGYNDYGQIGDGTTTTRTTPVDVSGLSSGVSAISTGDRHTCALMSTGGVKCWGYNLNGQLGDGTTTSRTMPVNVSGLSSGVSVIALGSHHTCAIMSTGGAKCWGYGGNGELGNGSRRYPITTATDVSGLSSGVAAIAAGDYHTCALLSTGIIKCWGRNDYGQLGDGTTTSRTIPVDVSELSSGVAAIAAGGGHTCVLVNTGEVKCWGDNYYGQLGDGTLLNSLMPTDVSGLSSGVMAIAVGGGHTCALMNTGGVKCWGFNNTGQVGDGTTTDRSTAVDVIGLSSGVSAIAGGSYHTCALTGTGGVKCWGSNGYGQLGDDTTTQRTTPVDVSGLSSGVSAITTGGYHTCALTSTGGVKCWGYNNYGQLGDGTTTNRTAPVNVFGLSSGVSAISTGSYHTCVLMNTGGVKCWGRNDYGQLGDGTTVQRLTPVDVSGLSSGVSAISAGWHTCVLMSMGGVKCWGSNTYGQLGDGTTTDRTTPVNVFGLSSGVSAISAGGSHTCALTIIGGVKCWGYDDYGQVSSFFSGYPHNVICD